MKKYFWLIFVFFFISRFFFLANYPHFYDSPEYLRESLSLSFFRSLASSHEVVHPIWLFLTQIFQKIISQPTSWELSLISAIFGLISLAAFYFLVKRLFDEKIAIFSLIPLVFFPHLWLIQTNILHESLDLGFFLLGLLFFDFFLEKRKLYWWCLAVLFLSLAILDFVGVLLWSVAFLGLAILRSKKKDLKKNLIWGFLTIFLSFILSFVGLFFLLLLTSIVEPIVRLKIIFFGFGGVGIFSGWGLIDILRILRNNLYILFYGYFAAVLGLILSMIGFCQKKKWPVLLFLLSFFIPFLTAGKFWHFGPYGRLAVLIAFPLSLFLALMPWRKIYWVLTTVIFLTFWPTFGAYQKTPIPQIQESLINKIGLKKEKDLLILSDYQRPHLVGNDILYIHGNDEIEKAVEKKIRKNLLVGNRVFISQQAIDFPYWQYDGQQIHIISKGDKNKAQAKKFLQDKRLDLVVGKKGYPLLRLYQLSLQIE